MYIYLSIAAPPGRYAAPAEPDALHVEYAEQRLKYGILLTPTQ